MSSVKNILPIDSERKKKNVHYQYTLNSFKTEKCNFKHFKKCQIDSFRNILYENTVYVYDL